MDKISKYELYELSVQSPDVQVDLFHQIYGEIRHKLPKTFREDFCGTFTLSAEWVKQHEDQIALALDLDPKPLKYGCDVHLRNMTVDQRNRLHILMQNVVTVTTPKVDLIGACNFSFYVFKERASLIEYFRCARKSLNKKGLLILEMAGGPGMIEKRREQKTVRSAHGKKFRYVWDQKSFNPITRNGHYAIHFKFQHGKTLKNAFTYDWRVWTIPEVREALIDAGFKDTCVYWDRSKSLHYSRYMRSENVRNQHAWIAQIVGIK
jgi:hypothetical protein